ncbi:MAG: hypothetical protein Q4F95_12330 [Oscillospiraceae bacterium]|nr:hypothetical protein [Oscillospiraceae bacterium]
MSDNKNEIIISKEYHIPIEMFASAFKDFQKKFVYPKNYIMTVVLAFIAVSYTSSLIKNPGNSVCVLIIILCAGLIFGMWMNPVMIRNKLMKSVSGIQNDRYIAEFSDDCLYISTTDCDEFENTADAAQEETNDHDDEQEDEDDFFKEPEEKISDSIPKTQINFIHDDIRTLEKNDYFLVYIVKKTFYVVPKNIFTHDEIETIKNTFSKGKFIPLKNSK